MKLILFEILIPAENKAGIEWPKWFHKKWDEEVSKICGGLTILSSVKGQWLDRNQTFCEVMIPVRIACSQDQIRIIAELTAKHYYQKSIMYYKISDEVVLYENLH